MNKFQNELKTKLKETKKISDNSINAYLKCLEKLNNGDSDFKNLDFLKDMDAIKKITDTYALNTQRNFYIAICSVLSLYIKYKPIYRKYFDILRGLNKTLKEIESENKKTITQAENWINWDDVMKKQKELYDEVLTFHKNKKLNNNEYLKLLKLMVLSLYTLQPPRRNKDFNMIVSKNTPDNKKDNYLNLNFDEFIFNSFKTKKTEGELTFHINDDLKKVIDIYLSHHPLIDPKDLKNKKGKIDVPFLVYQDGTIINPQNGITYILNNIFEKNVGSSILRHSYLTHKYSNVLKEQEEDSKAMSHSVSMARDYVKLD